MFRFTDRLLPTLFFLADGWAIVDRSSSFSKLLVAGHNAAAFTFDHK